MTLNQRYRTIYARLYGFKDHCDEQHHHVMRELEKELELQPFSKENLIAAFDAGVTAGSGWSDAWKDGNIAAERDGRVNDYEGLAAVGAAGCDDETRAVPERDVGAHGGPDGGARKPLGGVVPWPFG
jgi:hypothetical protein